MKKFSLILTLFFIGYYCQSQTDTLVTINDNKVSVNIQEITSKDVIYKLSGKTDLPLFHYPRKNLKSIIFKDGSEINANFNTIDPYQKIEIPKDKHIAYFTVSKIFQNHIGFAYEYIFKDNFMGIRVPLSVSFKDPYKFKPQGAFIYESDLNRIFTSGIDFNFYPVRLGKFKYTFGMGFQYAEYIYKKYKSFNYYYPWNDNNFTLEKGQHFSFVVNNGIITQVTKHLLINGSIGVGYQEEKRRDMYSSTGIRLNMTLNIGYMF